MEILKDGNLDITSVAEVSPGLSDTAVIEHANSEKRVIITFDKDFGELISREKLKVEGLILLRIPPLLLRIHSRTDIAHLISGILLENKLVIIREDRIRVTPFRHQIDKSQ